MLCLNPAGKHAAWQLPVREIPQPPKQVRRLVSLQKDICALTSVEQARGKPQTTGQFVVEGCTAQFKKNHDSLHFYKIPLLEIVLIVGAAEHQNLETFHL